MIGRTNVGGGGNTFAFIVVTYPAGSFCTCTDGTRTKHAKGTTGSFVFDIPYAGTWTVNCINEEETATESVTISEQGQSKSVELSYQIKEGLVSWYTFDDIVGTTVFDEIGDNNGTVTGSVTYPEGIKGNCIYSLQKTAYVEVPNSVIDKDSPFSISVWMKYEQVGSMYFANTSNNGSKAGIQFYVATNGKVNLNLCRASSSDRAFYLEGNTVLSVNQWHHVAVVYDNFVNGYGRLYIDGVLDTERQKTSTSTWSHYADKCRIGGYSSSNTMIMNHIDELRFYNRVLTSEEVSKIYTGRGKI